MSGPEAKFASGPGILVSKVCLWARYSCEQFSPESAKMILYLINTKPLSNVITIFHVMCRKGLAQLEHDSGQHFADIFSSPELC